MSTLTEPLTAAETSTVAAVIQLYRAEGGQTATRRGWRLSKIEFPDRRAAADLLGIDLGVYDFLDGKRLVAFAQHGGHRCLAITEQDDVALVRRWEGQPWETGEIWEPLPASAAGWLGTTLVPGGRCGGRRERREEWAV